MNSYCFEGELCIHTLIIVWFYKVLSFQILNKFRLISKQNKMMTSLRATSSFIEEVVRNPTSWTLGIEFDEGKYKKFLYHLSCSHDASIKCTPYHEALLVTRPSLCMMATKEVDHIEQVTRVCPSLMEQNTPVGMTPSITSLPSHRRLWRTPYPLRHLSNSVCTLIKVKDGFLQVHRGEVCRKEEAYQWGVWWCKR